MTSHTNNRECVWPKRFGLLVVLASLLVALLTFATASDSAAQECPDGSVLSDNGVTCELDVSSTDSICPTGQELDAAGLFCIQAEPADGEESPSPACDSGYSLGSDGQTCIADGPSCDRGEVPNDSGECVETFRCPNDLILASDLLSCLSDRCPDGELLSVDGKRCVAAGSDCPDGSPRPLGGACLVVETVEGDDGETEVVVRCAEADSFCQARIKRCADDRASGSADLGIECSDPRGSCDDDDDECAESNDRLVECATRDSDEGDDADPVAIGRANDPCADLCPILHRLDPSGECVEFLDPSHPCVISGTVPPGITKNAVLDGYSFLAGLGTCVTRTEFLRRLGNFEAAAGAEADALTLLRETTSSYLTIEDQLAELDQLLIDAELDVRSFTEAAAQADFEREGSAKLLLSTQKQLARERALLSEEVLQVFVVGGNDALIEGAILSATNVTEITVAQAYGRALLDDQVANIRAVEQLEEQAQAFSSARERAAADVEVSLSSAVSAADGLEVLREEAQLLRQEQLDRRDEEAELVAELRENKASFAQELGIFEQATLEIASIIEQTEFRVTTFAEFDGLLANPILPTTRISSNFGPRLHPILGYVRSHNGVDITAGFGEEILASGPGVVQIASAFGGYGNTVVVDHGGDLLTLYAHMSVILVEPGEEIELGDVIGLVGSTGLSTGPHLHFEVWEDGDRAVDPRPYLNDAE